MIEVSAFIADILLVAIVFRARRRCKEARNSRRVMYDKVRWHCLSQLVLRQRSPQRIPSLVLPTIMILRRTQSNTFSLISLFLFLSTIVRGQDDPFNCHITTNGQAYDLTILAGEHVATRTRDTPPSTMVDSLRFNLCADLNKVEGVADADQVRWCMTLHIQGAVLCPFIHRCVIQCATGTRACLTKTNKKNDNTDRVVAVIPIAQTSSLKPEYSTLPSRMPPFSPSLHSLTQLWQ